MTAPPGSRPVDDGRVSFQPMAGQDDPTYDLDALAAGMRADSSDVTIFFQVLGAKLGAAMPAEVKLQRESSLFKKEHPIRKITVAAGDDTFEAEYRNGQVHCRHGHAVRGIVLRTDEPGFDDWLQSLTKALAALAQSSAAARSALLSLVNP